jgi:hypothetical protein
MLFFEPLSPIMPFSYIQNTKLLIQNEISHGLNVIFKKIRMKSLRPCFTAEQA